MLGVQRYTRQTKLKQLQVSLRWGQIDNAQENTLNTGDFKKYLEINRAMKYLEKSTLDSLVRECPSEEVKCFSDRIS